MWTSCPAFSLIRISVHSTACTAAKPITSHNPRFGSTARAASHAASLRIESLRRPRAAAGEKDVLDMALA